MRWALLALVGCGGGLSAGDFPAEQRDATCSYYVRCGSIATIADCRTYFAANELDTASLHSALDAGKIRFDSDAAQDCVDAFDHLDCDLTIQGHDALAACDDVYTGTVKFGGACAFDGECQSERCMVDSECLEACCMGTCAEPRIYPGLDQDCSTVCDGDLFCGYDQKCHIPLQRGETCNPFTVCDPPLYCSTAGVCRDRPHRGELCEGLCASEGDACVDSVCVAAAVGGDPCSIVGDCSSFYVCNFDTRKCELAQEEPRLPEGSTCTFNGECESRYCNSHCAEPPICF